MANDVHTVSVADASDALAQPDRLGVVLKKSIPYGAGGGAHRSTRAAALTGLRLPATYAVFVGGLPADATAFVTSRTQSGLTLNVQPRLASATLSAGTVDLLIVY